MLHYASNVRACQSYSQEVGLSTPVPDASSNVMALTLVKEAYKDKAGEASQPCGSAAWHIGININHYRIVRTASMVIIHAVCILTLSLVTSSAQVADRYSDKAAN